MAKRKVAKFKVGQRVAVEIRSEHMGKPIVLPCDGNLAKRLPNGNFILRLWPNGLEAEISPSQIRELYPVARILKQKAERRKR